MVGGHLLTYLAEIGLRVEPTCWISERAPLVWLAVELLVSGGVCGSWMKAIAKYLLLLWLWLNWCVWHESYLVVIMKLIMHLILWLMLI